MKEPQPPRMFPEVPAHTRAAAEQNFGSPVHPALQPGRSHTTEIYVLVSDVGMNGNVVHGVYGEPPPQRLIDQAEAFVRGWTGYSGTDVEVHRLDSPLPCGERCTRRPAGTWSDCYCYTHQCNDRTPA